VNRAAQRVDKLTRRAKDLIAEAGDVRCAYPPRWRVRERRAAKFRYERLMAEAQDLIHRAGLIKVER
jgi:hypothetical protein